MPYKTDCPQCIGDGYYDLHCPYCDDDLPKNVAFKNLPNDLAKRRPGGAAGCVQKRTMTEEDSALAMWMSAALNDIKVCREMKMTIEAWFDSFDA